jgi:hypothetical protein
VEGSEIITRKFVIQRYNLGQDKLQETALKGPKMVAHRVKITQNDQISINSILTLPEPTVRFSQVNLPGTNLLVKANLNIHFLNYWQLLKTNTQLMPIVIDGLDNDIEYDDTNFVDNIKQYILDLSEYEKPPDLTNLDIYKIFLRTIIPKIRVLFNFINSLNHILFSLESLFSIALTIFSFFKLITFNSINDSSKFFNAKLSSSRISSKFRYL